MRILVTGGSGVIGEGVLPALLRDGHEVRLLSRGAEEEARRWPERVEAFAGDVSRAASLRGAAEGCEVVVHITGIVDEQPPEITFQSVNVEGTRNVVAEAERAGVRRFAYLSSLGADRGQSPYHHSKREGEAIATEFHGETVILRPGNVYGPGDDVISLLLKMMRTLPAIPVIDAGDQPFQPIWYVDLGEAVARVLVGDAGGQTLALTGAEVTSTNDLVERLSAITGRKPARIPLPSLLVAAGTKLAGAAGVELPINESKLTMLLEANVLPPGVPNGLDLLGVTPTPLDTALRALAELLPEQPAESGVGALERKRYWADIEGSRYDAPRLLALFRERATELMAIEFDPEPGQAKAVEEGATLTAALPLRGTIQMRVVEATPGRITFATLEGHPLAGVVRFSTAPEGNTIRFLVEIVARAATLFDLISMKTVGGMMQRANWEGVVQGVVDLSGGSVSAGTQSESVALEDAEAGAAEEELRALIAAQKRKEHAGAV